MSFVPFFKKVTCKGCNHLLTGSKENEKDENSSICPENIPFFSCMEIPYKSFKENYQKVTSWNSQGYSLDKVEIFGVPWENLGENVDDLEEIEHLLHFHLFDKSVDEYFDLHQIKV